MTAEQVVRYASSNRFLLNQWGKTGWIDRAGKVYTCAHATHEKLLYNALKMTGEEAESLGWVISYQVEIGIQSIRAAKKCAWKDGSYR